MRNIEKVPLFFAKPSGARRMVETAALLVDDVLPHKPIRQWGLSFPYPLRFLLASNPHAMGSVLGIVVRAVSGFLIKKSGCNRTIAHTGSVTLIQRFGSALNLNLHFHILFIDGLYQQKDNGARRFLRVNAPTVSELNALFVVISQRIACHLERRELLTRDEENSHLTLDLPDDDVMGQLLGHSITYRIAVGPLNRDVKFLPCKRSLPGKMMIMVLAMSVKSMVFPCMLAWQ